MTTRNNPSWWSGAYDNEWEQVHDDFRRTWAEDPGLVYAVGEHQRAATMSPPDGKATEQDYGLQEPAFRFGFGAQRQFGREYPEWNDGLANRLHQDWAVMGVEEWNLQVNAIRRGWEYAAQHTPANAAG